MDTKIGGCFPLGLPPTPAASEEAPVKESIRFRVRLSRGSSARRASNYEPAATTFQSCVYIWRRSLVTAPGPTLAPVAAMKMCAPELKVLDCRHWRRRINVESKSCNGRNRVACGRALWTRRTVPPIPPLAPVAEPFVCALIERRSKPERVMTNAWRSTTRPASSAAPTARPIDGPANGAHWNRDTRHRRHPAAQETLRHCLLTSMSHLVSAPDFARARRAPVEMETFNGSGRSERRVCN